MAHNLTYTRCGDYLIPDIHGQLKANAGNMVAVPEEIDAEALMKVLGNPEMAALLASLAKTVK